MSRKKVKLSELYSFQYGQWNTIENIWWDYPIYWSNWPVWFTNKYNNEDAPVIGHIWAYAWIVNWASWKHFVTYNWVMCNIKDWIDSKFWYYTLLVSKLQKRLRWSSQPFISYDLLNDIDVLLPETVEEQEKIGKVLSDIDGKIELNNKISSELEAMAKEIYDYRFVQFDFPDENGKPYKSSGWKMVWNEELKRKIPEGWEVSTLKGRYKIERGISYSSKDIELGDGVPMINLASIDRSRNYRDNELKYYSGKISDGDMLKPFDLLIACTDLTRECEIIWCPILTPDDWNSYTYSMDIAKIHFTDNKLVDLYMYMALRTDFYHNYIKHWASGTNVLHLNLDGLDWYYMSIPSVKLQEKYAWIIKTIHSKRSKIMVENNKLMELRDFLLPMLMNGQVTVK